MDAKTQRRNFAKNNPPADPLDQLVKADPKRVIALILWKARHRQPDLFVQITPEDIKGFDDCTRFLKVIPEVLIERPQGLPGQEAIPATAGRRAVAVRQAEPPRPYVIVKLVDKTTAAAIKPIENNQDDFDTAQQAVLVRKAVDQAPHLAARILEQGRTGEFSLSEIQDAANALLILAGAAL